MRVDFFNARMHARTPASNPSEGNSVVDDKLIARRHSGSIFGPSFIFHPIFVADTGRLQRITKNVIGEHSLLST